MADKLPRMELNKELNGSVGLGRLGLGLTLLLVLAACGQKGPLVLSDDKPAKPGSAASAPQQLAR
ncbi:lipoprotein [Pelomonas sp. SE-A7]|uniref:LPS translocon maturation chaperone LptM n=1 Tax=Pelomonas sp. SE-A7 TaxID=3054953 RepID=UPI00259CB735|nr:lipoprotein [Pelomonas sp. SE-A7]MDM4767731.1 lipoprotein [Pelomonas sp. SE-A7]